MSSIPDLDDINQVRLHSFLTDILWTGSFRASFIFPTKAQVSQTIRTLPSSWKFTEDDDDDELNPPPYTPYRPFQERDLPNGYELRMKTYRAAWTKCLDMVQVRLFILPVLTGHPKC
jgi:hypothetical protein